MKEKLPGCSIIIVAYNSEVFLPSCLFSVSQALQGLDSQIIVWDNGSQAPPSANLRTAYPQVEWLDSKKNLGFGVACNRSALKAKYEYLFFVNPDTIVSINTFHSMLAHVQSRSQVGVVGCRILNGDGSLQWACRRSFPSPLAAVYKTLGLAALFPNSRRFGAYNLTYLDDSSEAEVDAVSGSFFCIRAEVYRQVGGFDEEFFLYGEDLDICYRVQKAGYCNSYFPGTTVVHFKGQSSRTRMLRSYINFYAAMLIFARKHPRFRPIPLTAIALGIVFAAFLGVFSRLLPQWWKMVMDFAVILGCFFLGQKLFSQPLNVELLPMAWAAITLPLLFSGDYSTGGLDAKPLIKTLWPVLLGIAVLGIVTSMGQIAWMLALLLAVAIPGWRRFLYWGHYFRNVITGRRRRSLLLGGHAGVADFFCAENFVEGRELLGVVSNNPQSVSPQARLHLLGSTEDLHHIRMRTGVTEILVVPDCDGRHETVCLPDWAQKLRIKVLLAIGRPETSTFAVVDLNFLK